MDDKYEGREKRKFKRVRANPIVRFKLHSSPGEQVRFGSQQPEGVMMDIGEGGIGMTVDANVTVRSTLTTEFSLYSGVFQGENKKIIASLGEVRYNKPLGNRERRLGISFSGLSDADRFSITRFVRWEASAETEV
jgi:c-di-GMP-binding flagellar brake protein YcgR